MNQNDFLMSEKKCFKLIMQDDSNFVLYHVSSGVPIWHTDTARTGLYSKKVSYELYTIRRAMDELG